MSSQTLAAAVRDWFDANWTATPVRWENETFTEPTPTDYPAAPAAWLMVEFSGRSYDQMSIGSGGGAAERWAEEGAVLVHCIVQVNAGADAARQNAETIAEAFRGLQLPGGIRFRNMSIGDGGPADEDGNWWALTLRAEWMRG